MAEQEVSRRSFLTSLAAAGAAVAGAGLVACTPKADKPKEGAAGQTPTIAWDKEADFVVVGSGTAAWGAVKAAHLGLSVIVLEKSPTWWGGTSATCSGCLWLPCNYLMDEFGRPDDRGEAIKFMKIMANGQVADDVIESFVDNSPELALFGRDVINAQWGLMEETKAWGPLPIYIYDDRGGDICRSLNTEVPDWGNGSAGAAGFLWSQLHDKLIELGGEIIMGAEGKKLIQDETGAVIGIEAETEAGTIRVHANKGVLLGTGGFDYNEEYRHAFLKVPIINSCTVSTDTGDGITMGMQVGAQMRGLSNVYGEGIWLSPKDYTGPDMFIHNLDDRDSTFSPRSNPNSIIVNKHGRRFGNESSSYCVWNRAYESFDTGHLDENWEGYFIADKTYTEHYVLPLASRMDHSANASDIGFVPDAYVQADTLEELAEKLGIDKDGLIDSVKRYNEYCKEGKDYDFARGESVWGQFVGCDRTDRTDLVNKAMGPIENPPFYATMILPGSLGTSGGLVINANAQVLDWNNKPIKGLYASGLAALSVFGTGYPGCGAPIGSGSVMSFAAAKHAATL